MNQHKNKSSEFDVQKYYDKNADDAVEEVKKQGYTSIKYDTQRLVQGRPLSPIQVSKTVHIYVDSSTNTIHQIIMKH